MRQKKSAKTEKVYRARMKRDLNASNEFCLIQNLLLLLTLVVQNQIRIAYPSESYSEVVNDQKFHGHYSARQTLFVIYMAPIHLMWASGITACALRITSVYSMTDLGRMDSYVGCWLVVVRGSNDGIRTHASRPHNMRYTAP